MVKRYNRKDGVEDGTLQDKNGRWMEYSDYAKLEAELNRERAAYRELHRTTVDAVEENQRLRDAISGEWEGYGWKDGEYIDDLKEYFEEALKEVDGG